MTETPPPAVPSDVDYVWVTPDHEVVLRELRGYVTLGMSNDGFWAGERTTAALPADAVRLVPDPGQARELRVIHPRERDDMAAALHSAECDCGDRPHHERETGADYNQLATAAIKHARIAPRDTVQAPDVAAQPDEGWDVEESHNDGYFIVKHQVTGEEASCELDDCDEPDCVAEYAVLWDAVDRARRLRKASARALLGTDTTPKAGRD